MYSNLSYVVPGFQMVIYQLISSEINPKSDDYNSS